MAEKKTQSVAERFFSNQSRVDAFNKEKVKSFGNRAAKMGIGEYWVRLDKVTMKETMKAGTIIFEIAGTVVHVKSEECDHSVGEAVTQAFFPSSNFFYKDVKAFLASTLDTPTEEVTEQDILEVCAEDNPLADLVIGVKGVAKHGKEGTKHEGKVFCNLYWNGEISEEALGDLDEKVKATYLPDLATA